MRVNLLSHKHHQETILRKKHGAVEKVNQIVKRRITFIIIITIMFLCADIYPIINTIVNNNQQVEQVQSYKEHIHNIPNGEVNQQIQAARDYNRQLTDLPFQPPPIGQDATHPKYEEYSHQLRGMTGDAMATISIASQKINLPVYHGTSDQVLNKGAGHIFGTHLPVGGESTATALAAHTGLGSASMFDNLQHVQRGDIAIIRVGSEVLAYKMTESRVVNPDSVDAIPVVKGKDLLYLVTCTPYGINTSRLVVTFERTDVPSPLVENFSLSPTENISGMMYGAAWLAIAALIFSALLIWNEKRWEKKQKFMIAQWNG